MLIETRFLKRHHQSLINITQQTDRHTQILMILASLRLKKLIVI